MFICTFFICFVDSSVDPDIENEQQTDQQPEGPTNKDGKRINLIFFFTVVNNEYYLKTKSSLDADLKPSVKQLKPFSIRLFWKNKLNIWLAKTSRRLTMTYLRTP